MNLIIDKLLPKDSTGVKKISSPTKKIERTTVYTQDHKEKAPNNIINKEYSKSKDNRSDDILKKEPENNHRRETNFDVSEGEIEDFIEVQDIEIPGDKEVDEIIFPDSAKAEDLIDDRDKKQMIDEETSYEDVEEEYTLVKTKNESSSENDSEDSVHYYQTRQSKYLNAVLLQPETTNAAVFFTSSSPYRNIKSLTSCVLTRKRQHKEDDDEYIPDKSKPKANTSSSENGDNEDSGEIGDNCKRSLCLGSNFSYNKNEVQVDLQSKTKQTRLQAQNKQVKSHESAFIQSLARRSQRLATSVKTFKRSTKAGINAPTQRIRLNDTTAATVSSIKHYTENNDAEDLLQPTWIETLENNEIQISQDDETKKQQQQPLQQDRYSSSSELQTTCKPNPSPIPTSKFSERLYERNQKGIIVCDDSGGENNDNPSLDSALGFPKNVDPQMFINDENKDRCVICNQDFIGRLVYHYVNKHRGCEIYNSRLSPSHIKLVKQGDCEISNVSIYKRHKYYEAFCIFCQDNVRLISLYWYEHFTRHTGEFTYRCTGCGLRKPRRPDFRRHQAKCCPKARVAQDYFRSARTVFPIEANICNLCNYVQLFRSNMESHLHMQHNIKQILPEHIQTIALLSIPKSMKATSLGSKMDSRFWSKRDATSSLPSSSQASNTYVIDKDDNDVTFEKLAPHESPPQTNLHTIKNTFEEFTNSHKETRDLNNTDDTILLLSSHVEKSHERIIIGDGDDGDNENNGNPLLVFPLGFPKNVDPQMVINYENKERCVICKQGVIGRLVHHYVNEHRGCEIYNSRLSPSQIKSVKQARCEISKVTLYKGHKYYEAFCIFCQKNQRLLSHDWYEHFTRHTGEFTYRCTGCGLRKPRRPDFRRHKAQGCSKTRVVQDYFRSSKTVLPIEANVCKFCNYVQLHRSNIERHLRMQHNIDQILTEHIQSIALLSKPTSMTAKSTGSVINSSLGDEELDEIIIPDGVKAEDLTDDKNKEQMLNEKIIFEGVKDEKNIKIETTLFEKETSKNCDVDEKDEESGDNKSFANNDVQDVDDSSSKYCKEYETEFISVEEGELNKLRVLYNSKDKSTSISSNVFQSFKSPENIVAATTEEFKSVCPQAEEQINTTTTKIDVSIVNMQGNKEKAANKSKTIVDNDKNIKIEHKKQMIDEETLYENDDSKDSVHYYQTPQSKYINTFQLQPETTNSTVSFTSSSSSYPNIKSLTLCALTRKRQHEEDEDEYILDESKAKTINKSSENSNGEDNGEISLRLGKRFGYNEVEVQVDLQSKTKQTRLQAQNKQVKSHESAFIQSLARRSQRLATSVKTFKRSTKAAINAPTQRIKLNDTTASTATSIKLYTENNDAEDLSKATWIENLENYETQLTDDDEAKKQQDEPKQQDRYSASYELQSTCKPNPSPIPTSNLSEGLYERNQKGIIVCDDDGDENNDNPCLDSALGFPKNVDPQMFVNNENKDRCVICNQDFFGRLVYHYVNEHRGCEIYNSRLSQSQIKLAKKGRCHVSNVSPYKKRKYFEAFCIFCQENLRLIARYWYYHFIRHTGEFAYRCTGCGLRKARDDFKTHQAQGCPKARVAEDYFRSSKAVLPIEANVCNFCNYVQLYRSNIERHLHIQHNIEQILPEHIQTIVLLSMPKSIKATPRGRKIYSRRWNKSDAASLLPSSLHDPNTYAIDNDVDLEKMLKQETSQQIMPPTINNTFEESTNCHYNVICSKIITFAEVTAANA